MAILSAPPDGDALILDGSKKLFMAPTWLDWFVGLVAKIALTAQKVVTKTLTDQSAAVGTTPLLAAGTISAPRFRVSVFLRITQQATTSSALSLTINTVHRGQACTMTTPVMISNNKSKPESTVFEVLADTPLLLSFFTTYASVGATPMTYDADVVVEALTA